MYMNSLSSNKCVRTADLLRCLRAAAAVIGLCAFFCGVEIGRAQGTTVEEKFRQATQAMREQRLDEASEGFVSVIAASPSFAEAYFD